MSPTLFPCRAVRATSRVFLRVMMMSLPPSEAPRSAGASSSCKARASLRTRAVQTAGTIAHTCDEPARREGGCHVECHCCLSKKPRPLRHGRNDGSFAAQPEEDINGQNDNNADRAPGIRTCQLQGTRECAIKAQLVVRVGVPYRRQLRPADGSICNNRSAVRIVRLCHVKKIQKS